MKVVCVHKEGHNCAYVTIGKIYDLVYESRELYHLLSDDGIKRVVRKICFKPLDEYRNKKLEEIGI